MIPRATIPAMVARTPDAIRRPRTGRNVVTSWMITRIANTTSS
jgi:hypothetical protein